MFTNCFTNCLLFLFPGDRGSSVGEMPTGPMIFQGLAGRVWAAALRQGPTLKKALCRTCLVVGWRTNKVHQTRVTQSHVIPYT